MKIKRIIKEYYELYAQKFNEVDEMEQLLKRYKLPKLMQREIDNLSGQGRWVNNHPRKKTPVPGGFSGKF